MESFSPQGRRAPFPFSMRLREGASRQLRQGAMAALRLGAPFTTMGKTNFGKMWWSPSGCHGQVKSLVVHTKDTTIMEDVTAEHGQRTTWNFKKILALSYKDLSQELRKISLLVFSPRATKSLQLN